MLLFIKYFIATFFGLVSFFGLYFARQFYSLHYFIATLVVWFAILILGELYIYHRSVDRKKFLFLVLLVNISFVLLVLFQELPIIGHLLNVLAGLVTAYLFSRPPLESREENFHNKYEKRIEIFIIIFSLFSVLSTGFAMIVFFQSFPFWLFNIAVSVLSYFLALQIWHRYRMHITLGVRSWAAVLALMLFELNLSYSFLPLGYYVMAFLSTWLWYLGTLFIRFNLTAEGVVWKKQISFLLVNIVLFLAFVIYFVRWI